jgi:hypothetical protein
VVRIFGFIESLSLPVTCYFGRAVPTSALCISKSEMTALGQTPTPHFNLSTPKLPSKGVPDSTLKATGAYGCGCCL